MGSTTKTQARDRLQELREMLAMAEAECTRHIIEADRLTHENTVDGNFDLARYDDIIGEARKHARIAAGVKRQIVTLGAEVRL